MGGSPASPSEVLRTMTGAGGPKHLGGSATQFFIQVERIPLVLLVLPLVHLVLVLVHLVLVLVLISSSCNLENRERDEESGGGAGSVGSSSTLYFCSNWFVLHRSPGSSIHNS